MPSSIEKDQAGCQIGSIPKMGQVIPDSSIDNISLKLRVKLLLKRTLSMEMKRDIKKRVDKLRNKSAPLPAPTAAPSNGETAKAGFAVGELVRIRPMEEIRETLDMWQELKGCGFMDEMEPYCGTVQKVWKVVQRFVDERDYKVKKVRGLYILEGLVCQGTKLYGQCDRSCFFFWREEWLERVAEPTNNQEKEKGPKDETESTIPQRPTVV